MLANGNGHSKRATVSREPFHAPQGASELAKDGLVDCCVSLSRPPTYLVFVFWLDQY